MLAKELFNKLVDSVGIKLSACGPARAGCVGFNKLDELLQMAEATFACVLEKDFDEFLRDDFFASRIFFLNNFARILTDDPRFGASWPRSRVTLFESRRSSSFRDVWIRHNRFKTLYWFG